MFKRFRNRDEAVSEAPIVNAGQTTAANANSGRDQERDQDLLRCLEAARQGDYTVRPTGDDAISTALRRLIESLRDRASADLDRAVDVSIHANESSISVAQMLGAGREVDERVQSIAAAAEEMAASVHQISETSQGAASDAEEVQQTVAEGVGAVNEAVSTMARIADTVQGAAARADNLHEASREIGTIVEEIDAIANQTNLLALNATIEAARAGEAGKGFAVVAGEVKNLSQQTAKATEDISNRIENLRTEIEAIVQAMGEGSAATEEGRKMIDNLGHEMEGVGGRVRHVSESMAEIAGILAQQTEASNQVSEGVSAIAAMTERNVRQIEQLSDVMDHTQTLTCEQIQVLAGLEIPNKVPRLAKADHVVWKKKLADMAVGRVTLKADELNDHHSCRLGQWYYSDDSLPYRAGGAFGDLEAPHAAVHSHGKEAARLFERGDISGALAEIEKVEEASTEVLDLLDKLEEGGSGAS